MSAYSPVSLSLSLPLRNQATLDTLIHRLYDPKDPAFGHYLTSQQFIDSFAPSESDYQAVIRYAQSQGLTVTATYPNRTLVDVQGSASGVEHAFTLQMHHYVDGQGRVFHSPDRDPSVPITIAGKLNGIVGLEDAPMWRTYSEALSPQTVAALQPYQVGSGPGGALTPSDIKTAYNLNNLKLANSTTALDGAGQTLALFELDGYNAADINTYANYYHLNHVPLQNVLIDGYSGAAGANAGEVVLDIELMMAVAPGATKIRVYEGPNSGSGVIHTYNQIAVDNIAKQVSSSWGLPETWNSSGTRNAENSIFQQMAAQGQSMYAASGDAGAYDDKSTLTVDDPASQPYVTGVGGTQLFVNSDHTYKNESTWNHGAPSSGGGGGGISAIWGKPAWQAGFGASATMRNVPDVSLTSDPYSGYSIYFSGGWYIFGGTSCAAPLWAGITALVNQQRTANSSGTVGFMNPQLYSVGGGASYTRDFHDIADGSTNMYYVSHTGYDNATGLGSFNGANLIADLSTATSGPPPLMITVNPSAVPGRTYAQVNWATNNAASTVVKYGQSPGSLTRSISITAMQTTHIAAIGGLLRRSRYYYTASSTASGTTVTSAVGFFTTN
jgi:subtilase family serine protease